MLSIIFQKTIKKIILSFILKLAFTYGDRQHILFSLGFPFWTGIPSSPPLADIDSLSFPFRVSFPSRPPLANIVLFGLSLSGGFPLKPIASRYCLFLAFPFGRASPQAHHQQILSSLDFLFRAGFPSSPPLADIVLFRFFLSSRLPFKLTATRYCPL